MNKMKIEVWSDIACPYCYIGKRKLETALSRFRHRDRVEVVWRSYELNPSLPKQPLNKAYAEYLAGQYGVSVQEMQEKNKKVVALAEEAGLDYDLERLPIVNTSDALRMVKLADRHGLSDEMEEALFKSYFTDGEDVSDKETLIRLGSSVGIPEEEIAGLLNGDEFAGEIKSDMDYSENKLGLEYIPFYLFNNKHIIQGSIDVDGYLSVLEKAYDEWVAYGVAGTHAGNDMISGQACSIDGVCE